MENLTKSVNLVWNASRVVALAVLMGTVACGTVGDGAPEPGESLGTQGQELTTANGITVNGITVNGITVNGITVNGITVNGMATLEFSTWFGQDVEQNATLMSYLVKCAVPAGQARSYQEPASGTTYTWQGSLGLAPDWASGQPITEAEQQIISACLAAHVNKYGIHVPLSILGRTATQEPISYSAEELQTFNRREGCFFGNLFTGEGIFAGADRGSLFDEESSLRACALTSSQDGSSACAPMVHVQRCEDYCTLDPSGLFYTECNYNGRTYLPLTTRISQDVIYTCGDGVCQYTEGYGMSTACEADCGSFE